MKRVIIRIAAYFAGAALLWGCFGEYGPTPTTGDVIRFRAGADALFDDNTRTATLLTSESVVQSFRVFSLLNNNASNPVFDNTLVVYHAPGWECSETKHWAWAQNEDWYDFIAVAPDTAGASRLVGAPGRLTVTTDYDVTSDNHDLMVAGYVRTGETPLDQRTLPVPLAFKHMLSAVKVDFINISGSGSFTLNSYCFKNVVNVATLKATFTAANRESFLWINAESSSSAVRAENPPAGTHNPVSPGDTLVGAGFNLFIPQRLDESVNDPVLEITYTPSGAAEPTTVPVPLPGIKSVFDDSPINEWELGVKYTYEIRLRLDGGVEVRVKTVDWDKQVYETPGIMIPE